MKHLNLVPIAAICCAIVMSCVSSKVDLAEQARQDSILIHDSLMKEFYFFTTADLNFCDVHGHVKSIKVTKDKENGIYGDDGTYEFSMDGRIVSHPILHIDEDIPEGVSHVEESNYVERDKVGRISGNAYSDYKWKDNMLVSEDNFFHPWERFKSIYIYDGQERIGYSRYEWKDIDDGPYLKDKVLYKNVKYDKHDNWVSHIDNGAKVTRTITYYDEPDYETLITEALKDFLPIENESDEERIARKIQMVKNAIKAKEEDERTNFISKDLTFF